MARTLSVGGVCFSQGHSHLLRQTALSMECGSLYKLHFLHFVSHWILSARRLNEPELKSWDQGCDLIQKTVASNPSLDFGWVRVPAHGFESQPMSSSPSPSCTISGLLKGFIIKFFLLKEVWDQYSSSGLLIWGSRTLELRSLGISCHQIQSFVTMYSSPGLVSTASVKQFSIGKYISHAWYVACIS